MNYPQKLPLHDIYNFDIISVLKKDNENRIQAKYHTLSSTAPDLPYLPMHVHEFYEINIITRGNSMHYINDNIYSAPVGTVFVIPPRIRHGYFSEDTTEIFHLILDYTFISSYASLLNSLKGYSFLFDIEPVLRLGNKFDLFLKMTSSDLEYIRPVLDRLCIYEKNYSKDTRLASEFLALNMIAELCKFAHRNTYIKDNYSDGTDNIIRIMEYISCNCKEKVNFHQLAKNNNMSYATFFRHFKKICCMTPMQYLTTCRINEAINMMMENKYTLTDIALSCGFYDSSHFTKSFISINGCPPTDFLN